MKKIINLMIIMMIGIFLIFSLKYISDSNIHVNYKVGDCVRYYNYKVYEYQVVEVFKRKYVLASVFRRDGKLNQYNKTVFTTNDLYDNSKKIDCKDIE